MSLEGEECSEKRMRVEVEPITQGLWGHVNDFICILRAAERS